MALRSLLVLVANAQRCRSGFSQKTVSRQQDKVIIASEHVKQVLLILDTDDGKISKQEFMNFMEARSSTDWIDKRLEKSTRRRCGNLFTPAKPASETSAADRREA